MCDPSLDPHDQADLQFVIKAEERDVQAPDRQRENAARAWTIAGVLAAVVLAGGFTSALQTAASETQVAGVLALGLWFIAALLFMRISIPPKASNTRLKKLVDQAKSRISDADLGAADSLQRRSQERWWNLIGSAEFAARRLRRASWFAAAAAVATVVALALTVLLSAPEETTTGMLILTPVGQDAVADACPNIDGTTTEVDGMSYTLIEGVTAEVHTDELATETSLAQITFAAGDCDASETDLFIDRAQLVGVMGP